MSHSRCVFSMILETAVQGAKVIQDLELESFSIGVDHSQKVKATPIETDYGSRDCVNLAPSTAVSRMILGNLFGDFTAIVPQADDRGYAVRKTYIENGSND